MTDPVFGISFTRLEDEARPAIAGDLSVVGLIGTAPDANGTTYPVNTPVHIFSDDATALAALGSDGTLPDAIKLLNAQLGAFQSAAHVVVVRVTDEATTAATIANIVGDGVSTGLAAFLSAGSDLGYTPRLIAAPGFTSQQSKGVGSLTIANAGSGYDDGTHSLTASGGGGSGFAGTATVAGGVITGVTVTSPGTGYTSAPTISLTALGAGSAGSVTATLEDLANPVVVALPPILEKLLAHAVVDGPGTNLGAAIDWREDINSQRIIPVEPAVKVMDGVSVVTQPLSPAVLGIAVRRDHEFGGRPFHSWANQPVYGIVGPSRPIKFSLTDGATEAQSLLAANIGVLVRGEMGVEAAISSGGFIFIGTDNAGDDPLWQFYNQTRGRDYIHLMFLRSLRYYLGRYNITGQTVQAVINTMENGLSQLQATGDIIGFKVDFERGANTVEKLRLGRIDITFRAEEAPVLRRIHLNSGRYGEALDALIENLTAQVSV